MIEPAISTSKVITIHHIYTKHTAAGEVSSGPAHSSAAADKVEAQSGDPCHHDTDARPCLRPLAVPPASRADQRSTPFRAPRHSRHPKTSAAAGGTVVVESVAAADAAARATSRRHPWASSSSCGSHRCSTREWQERQCRQQRRRQV